MVRERLLNHAHASLVLVVEDVWPIVRWIPYAESHLLGCSTQYAEMPYKDFPRI